MKKNNNFLLRLSSYPIAVIVVIVMLVTIPSVTIFLAQSQQTKIRAASVSPSLAITSIAQNNSSVKIDFLPVTGAKDYRVYDISNPSSVKYAGMVHLDAGTSYHFVTDANGTPVIPYQREGNFKGSGPQSIDTPSTEIEWNTLQDNLPHTLVVEAVDQLGPVPSNNLTDANNDPISSSAGMLGSNVGSTLDGKTSTNGQGASINTPGVLATSQPFTVQANVLQNALPSKPDALQTFYDTFDDTEALGLVQTGVADAVNGTLNYTLNAGTSKAWDILLRHVDTDHSMAFIKGAHFMDTLFEGRTLSGIPPYYPKTLHTDYSNISLSPQASADFSDGKLLHLTEEVDSQLSRTYRWLAWQLAPANDPITNFRAADDITGGSVMNANKSPINTSDQALWLQLFPANCEITLFEGPRSAVDLGPIANNFVPVPLQLGQQQPTCYRVTQHNGGNGIGLDNRERWDIFLTTNHLALFEDGQLVVQKDIPDGGLPFSQAKLYFTQYAYALADNFEKKTIQDKTPWFTYWADSFKYSDERHWDNMGFEVLPSTEVPLNNDFSTLSSLINMPVAVSIVTITSTPTVAPSITPTIVPLTPSPTSVACGPLDMPKNFSPLGSIPAGQTTISWDSVENALSYKVNVDDQTNAYSGMCSKMNAGDFCSDQITQTSVPYTFVTGHTYVIWVQAKDSCGNQGKANGVTVMVPPLPTQSSPLISLQSPLDGSTVPSNTTITIIAHPTIADDMIHNIVFSANGKIICGITTTPYSCNWYVPAGSATYTIQASLYDSMLNSTSSRITVTSK